MNPEPQPETLNPAQVKEFLLGIINAARGDANGAGAEGEGGKAIEGGAGGGKKLGRVPGLGGKADASKPEL